MKKLLLIFPLLVFPTMSLAYYVDSFYTDIKVYSDGYMKVTETIKVDFEDELHHGIYRYIPYKYRIEGKWRKIRIKIISVSDELGHKRMRKITRRGGYLYVRIGNPRKLVSGLQTYVITYKVYGTINFFDDYDELWWNVNGTEWTVPIHSVGAQVTILGANTPINLDARCYTGVYGSTRQDCQYSIEGNRVVFDAGYLGPKENLSIVVKIPKGIIKEPSAFAKFMNNFVANIFTILGFLLPIIGFLYIFNKWKKEGRDPIKKTVIMVTYEPPDDLLPAEVGTVIDERANISDITATIVDLAVKGYLKIVETESEKFLFFKKKDYALILLKDFETDENLTSFERKFLRYLFDVGEDKGISPEDLGAPEGKKLIFTSTLKNKFHTKLIKLKEELYKQLIKKKYFPENPETVRKNYLLAGVLFMIVAAVVLIITYGSIYPFSIGLAVTGLIWVIFSPIMPRKTRKGAMAAIKALGFREFIERAEKDRIEKLAKDDPTIFERILPYAMVFGVADAWVEKFEGIFKEPPKWFVGARPMGLVYFSTNLGHALHTISYSMAYRARGAAGGGSGFSGGFSGGGFGGGGGGAW